MIIYIYYIKKKLFHDESALTEIKTSNSIFALVFMTNCDCIVANKCVVLNFFFFFLNT